MKAIASKLGVEPMSNFNLLDLSLPWNPVDHATIEMSCVSKSLQLENMSNALEADKTMTTFTEVFDSVLNRSGKFSLVCYFSAINIDN